MPGIIPAMLLKAGALSLLLLLASRLLGLARESAQAAAFGATGLADLAVLMLTLPDWVTGVLAAGALSYVLVPAWAGRPTAQVDASQRRVARAVLGLGLVLGLAAVAALAVVPEAVLGRLAPGLPATLSGAGGPAAWGLGWSAVALAPALLAALWATRLQHEGDAVGLYGANLVVNGTLVAGIALAGWGLGAAAWGMAGAVTALGLGLMAAMGLRLAWQAWRERRAQGGSGGAVTPMDVASATSATPTASSGLATQAVDAPSAGKGGLGDGAIFLPPPSAWAWAVLAAGLPLALPFAARSLASAQGEGALAIFNYAWKLVELPLMLAIQLVATLAFPRVATAVAAGLDRAESRVALQAAFGLAFALACAACAGLLLAADAAAQVLFGWGRMDATALAHVAAWGRVGAWSLLPQAVSAVGLTVLAAQGRLRPAALWHALALAGLLAVGAFSGTWGTSQGAFLMGALDAVLALVALGVLAAMGAPARRSLPWAAMGAALAVVLGVAVAAPWLVASLPSPWPRLALALLAAGVVLAAAWACAGPVREGLRARRAGPGV